MAPAVAEAMRRPDPRTAGSAERAAAAESRPWATRLLEVRDITTTSTRAGAALARWAGATTWDALSAPPRRAARWVAGMWEARLGPAEMRARGERALRGEEWPPLPQHPLPSAVATREATIDLGGGIAYAMRDGFTVPQFADLTWTQRSAWVHGFMGVTGVPKFWNFIGVLRYLAEDPNFAPLDSWASVADAGVLQAVQDGWRCYIGLAPIGYDGHGDAGLGWAEFFRRHLQGDPYADQIWGSAEVQGVRFGMAIARREFGRATWQVRDKIEWFVDVGDGYRWVKVAGLDLDGPLAPWIRPIFAADHETSARAVYAVAKLAVREGVILSGAKDLVRIITDPSLRSG